MRLIDVDALMYRFMDKPPDYYHTSYIVGEINAAPTVDVVPVKHGAWEEETVSSIEENACIQDWQSARCSVCKRYLTTPYIYYFSHYNYCPNCGAKMNAEPKSHENT